MKLFGKSSVVLMIGVGSLLLNLQPVLATPPCSKDDCETDSCPACKSGATAPEEPNLNETRCEYRKNYGTKTEETLCRDCDGVKVGGECVKNKYDFTTRYYQCAAWCYNPTTGEWREEMVYQGTCYKKIVGFKGLECS
jgi:hypothetical protein